MFGEETDALVAALEQNDVPFDWDMPDSIVGGENIFVRGTLDFVNLFERRFGEYCNNFSINLENYEYCRYSQFYKPLYNSHFIVFPWHRLPYSLGLVSKCFPNSDKYFIRPNSGRKIFTGTTLTAKWYDKELDIIKGLPSSTISDHDMIIIAPFKEIIENEYRVLMYNDTIVDFSIYNEINEERLTLETIQKFFQQYKLPQGPDLYYTIDITGHNNLTSIEIIEINSCPSAGWYDMDCDKIVKHMLEQTEVKE